jgi:hypothetical protein
MSAGAAARPQDVIARYERYLVSDPHNETLVIALDDLHHRSAETLKRPIGPEGRSMFDPLHAHLRKQAARADQNAAATLPRRNP